MTKWWSAVGLGATLTASPALAAAQPVTASSIQLGIGFRYGFELNEGDFNPWGPGLGLDAGYTLPSAVYLGANVEYFFGETVEDELAEISGNVWQLTAEGGYDLGLGDRVVIRPKLGLGLGAMKVELCSEVGVSACDETSSKDLAATPGVSLIYLGPSFGLDVDLRYALIFADQTAKALLLSVGFGF